MNASRVLIVDSNEAAREIIAKFLTDAGCEVTQAASGAEALAVLDSSGEHDLMLTDLAMAGMDGAPLLQHAKVSYPDMPVIICTGNDPAVAPEAVRQGAYDYLARPFQREQVLMVLARALEYRRLKLENRAYHSKLESAAVSRSDQLSQALTDLERSYDLTIEIAADLQSLKDSASAVHARYVTAFTIALARAMGMSGEKIRDMARAAILHDIGMIAVPDGIIHKPGPLTGRKAGAQGRRPKGGSKKYFR